jgi:hypothetical protein
MAAERLNVTEETLLATTLPTLPWHQVEFDEI